MKCTVEKNSLLAHLQKVCNIVGKNTTLPILANVYIEARKESLCLRTTDLEISIMTELKAEVEKTGITTIPARNLLALISKFKGDNVEIETKKNYHAQFKCGDAEFMLKALDPENFPKMNDFSSIRTIRVKQTALTKWIDNVIYAVSVDDSRKPLLGVFFTVKDNIMTSVATDGKRLAIMEQSVEESSGDGDFILPQKAAYEIKRLLGKEDDAVLEVDDSGIRLILGDTVFYSRFIEGAYPNFRQIIPAKCEKKIDIPCKNVLESLDLLSVSIPANVELKFEQGFLKLSSKNDNIGEGHDKIEIIYDYNDPLELAVNIQFLAAPFKFVGGEQFRFKATNSVSPIVIEDGNGFRYILMPMRTK